MKTIRLLDCTFSILGLIILIPVFVVLAVVTKITSSGPVLYSQVRVGKGGKLFSLLKFRSMRTDADKAGLLTVGGKDSRVTPIGYYLRRFKLDELPQLLNVLMGDMSLVGPRPEVPKYVAMYTPDQQEVLRVRPGITDLASIVYRNENELLASAPDPEAFYIKEIMPDKIRLNRMYLQKPSVRTYFSIIFKTIASSVKGK
jgi:lipopolysaccharide/colanic/teichoic acid biosynthesis glycosyltransferase